jgi:hypothetical protein
MKVPGHHIAGLCKAMRSASFQFPRFTEPSVAHWSAFDCLADRFRLGAKITSSLIRVEEYRYGKTSRWPE